MERHKKNTVMAAAEQKVNGTRSDSVDVKGAMSTCATEDSEQIIPAEINGPKGPEPTRYGDWEQKGRCTDF